MHFNGIPFFFCSISVGQRQIILFQIRNLNHNFWFDFGENVSDKEIFCSQSQSSVLFCSFLLCGFPKKNIITQKQSECGTISTYFQFELVLLVFDENLLFFFFFFFNLKCDFAITASCVCSNFVY